MNLPLGFKAENDNLHTHLIPQPNQSRAFNPAEMSLGHIHHTLLSVVAPRPIAFASTIDREGRVNLSPFSYFNVFGINPPTVIFSPARSVRTLEHKDTLLNVQEVAEVVINLIDMDIVEQASLASCAFPRGVNEFEKAGLEMLASDVVRPPRVAASPASLECIVEQIIPVGEGGGSGNLIVGRIVRIHVREDLLTEEGKVNLTKLKMVGRMGGNYYVNASGAALFEVEKPNEKRGMGFDALPDDLRESPALSGAELARLANLSEKPVAEPAEHASLESYLRDAIPSGDTVLPAASPVWLPGLKQFLAEGKPAEAWKWYQLNS